MEGLDERVDLIFNFLALAITENFLSEEALLNLPDHQGSI